MNRDPRTIRQSGGNTLRNASLIALTVGAAATGVAQANTGGASFDNSPAPKTQKANQACPSPDKITKKKTLSAKCRSSLMRTLRKSVYDDATDTLAVATYQKIAKVPGVDGSLGPITAKSILLGKGLRVTSPDPANRAKKEIYIRKRDQVAYLLGGNNTVKSIVSVSSGSEIAYSGEGPDKDQSGDATTPTGTWKINSRVNGADYEAPLGAMPYARFFHEGYAVHAGDVSTSGMQSHGCIRFEPETMRTLVVPYGTGDTVKIVP